MAMKKMPLYSGVQELFIDFNTKDKFALKLVLLSHFYN